MPEMSDDEKAARLAYYKQQAQERWDEHELELMTGRVPLSSRWQLYISVAIVLFIGVFCGLVYLVYIR